MQTIPFIDIRSRDHRQLIDTYPEKARDLILASKKTLGIVSHVFSTLLLPKGDEVSRHWLERSNNPYFQEIKYYADKLQLPGIYALNICFEWGCTSSVYGKEDGPTLTRVLDWMFPKLGENIVVAHQKGSGGEFYNVTWPGVSGVFHALAPGRFAASLNQAPMQKHTVIYPVDWVKNRQQVFKTNALPPAHLLRQVFEEAKNFAEARDRLARTPVAIPVIYILAGMRGGEGCVIERTETDYVIRALENDRVCASNQFDTRLNEKGRGWRPRPVNSAGRVTQARSLHLGEINDTFVWFKPPIANSHTRLAMIANASTGKLSVFGTYGVKPVTEVFRL